MASRMHRLKPIPTISKSFTCCFAVDYLDGQDHTIERPAEYDFWRDFVPTLKHAWPGRLLDLNYSDPSRSSPQAAGLIPEVPARDCGSTDGSSIPRTSSPAAYPGSSGISLINWPQNDYWLGPLIGTAVSRAQADAARCAGQAVESLASCTGCKPNALVLTERLG